MPTWLIILVTVLEALTVSTVISFSHLQVKEHFKPFQDFLCILA